MLRLSRCSCATTLPAGIASAASKSPSSPPCPVTAWAASELAQFGQPEINIGVIPSAGGTQRLTRAIGKSKAMEMVLTGRTMSAREAEAAGLVSRVVPVESCLDEALKLAREIASKAPLAARFAKEAVNKVFETSLADGIENERRWFYFLFATKDQKEGMKAFIEKRPPEWKGK